MEKIREYMDNRSVENTRKLLTEELDVIHQQIQELNRLQKNVEERLLTLSGAEDQALLKNPSADVSRPLLPYLAYSLPHRRRNGSSGKTVVE